MVGPEIIENNYDKIMSFLQIFKNAQPRQPINFQRSNFKEHELDLIIGKTKKTTILQNRKLFAQPQKTMKMEKKEPVYILKIF